MRIVFSVLGGLLIAVGSISLWGAIEIARGGATSEQLAQGFLVPVSLFVVGGFAIWGAWKGRG